MRGTRAKDLRKLAIARHDPQFANKTVTTQFPVRARTGEFHANGMPKIASVNVDVVQHHPKSIRGTYKRAKAAYKQWMQAGHPAQMGA